MSKAPSFIPGLGKGDSNSYRLDSRVSKAHWQYVYDMKSEWETSQSEVVRKMIEFFAKYYPQVAKAEGHHADESIVAKCQLIEAMGKAIRRHEAEETVRQAYIEAMRVSDSPEIKEGLLEAGERYAKSQNIEWPPKEIPLTSYDHSARYYLERVMQTIRKSGENRVTLRDVTVNSSGSADDVLRALTILKEHGYVELEEEQRSGPMTVWVSIPMMEVPRNS